MSPVFIVALIGVVGALIFVVFVIGVLNFAVQGDRLQAEVRRRGWRYQGGALGWTLQGEAEGTPVEIRLRYVRDATLTAGLTAEDTQVPAGAPWPKNHGVFADGRRLAFHDGGSSVADVDRAVANARLLHPLCVSAA